mgnify:CR=1 FL=1
MYRLLVVLLTLSLASIAFGADVGNVPQDKGMDSVTYGDPVARQGGDNIGDATVIPGIPYSDTGVTCGYLNDYDEVCPYGPHTSPDVVYAYTPAADGGIDIDLCGSGYDTKLFVYQDAATPGSPWACNDDFYTGPPCGLYVSFLANVPVFAGHTYYIVIDGYGGACGDYILEITEAAGPCIVDCWTDAVPEGEPTLQDGYVDNYNGGCNSTPYVFQDINWANEDGGAWMCAIAGWFDGTTRDTDWFPVVADGFEIQWVIQAEYNFQALVIQPYDCIVTPIYEVYLPLACEEMTISIPTSPGQEVWLWAGPAEYTGPVNEFTYFQRVYGIVADVIATEQTTMGTLKSMYK